MNFIDTYIESGTKQFKSPCGWKVKIYGLDYGTTLVGELIVHLGWRSSLMSKEQMSEMIELMYAYGAEHGVVWQDRN